MSSVTGPHLFSQNMLNVSCQKQKQRRSCPAECTLLSHSSEPMEFVGHRGSSSSTPGAAGLLVVPAPNYQDFEADLDDEDGEVVFGIRPKSSPQPRRKISVSEDDSEISEPPSLCGSRRVSFADAIGLSLVQVKEFDKWDVPQLPDFLESANKEEEEYFISPFNFPLSLPPEEIIAKVQDQKIELESIELLPGTTTLKGAIRVLNISFTKTVYVRTSLDNWSSHFDLLCEYVPGSGDGLTDSFAFKLTLVPPLGAQGVRVDFCLRYETPVGTFWGNNSNRNYILLCFKQKKDVQDKPSKENVNKKSCLKTVSQSYSVEESMFSPEQEKMATDVTQPGQKVTNESLSSQIKSSPVGNSDEDGQMLQEQVENKQNRSRRNRRKAARMARVKDYFSQQDTNNSENGPSAETQTETAQEENQAETYSNPEGNVKLEDTADPSLSKDTNSKTEPYESINLADSTALTTMGDRPDGSKELPNAESAFEQCQNTNKLVPSSEERSLEPVRDCSGERDDRERLVSNSSGYAFGTVVAPLYHQVSGRMESQPYIEPYSSVSTSHQEMKDGCREKDGATFGIVETRQDLNELEDRGQVSTNSLNCDSLHAQGKILELKTETQDADLSCDLQETSAQAAVTSQLSENVTSHNCIGKNMAETVIESEQDSSFDLANQTNITNNVIDEPSLGQNGKMMSLAPSNATFQEENVSLSFQLCQNECLFNHSASTSDVPGELGVETDDKTMATMSQSHASVSCEEENPSLSLEQNESLSDKPTNLSEVISEPSLDDDAGNKVVSPSHESDAKEENPPWSPSETNELSLEIDNKTMASKSPSHGTETSEKKNVSLLLQISPRVSFPDQPTFSKDLTDQQSLACDVGDTITTSPSLVSMVSEHPSLSCHPYPYFLANEAETNIEFNTKEKIADPFFCFKALEVKEVTQSFTEIGDELISKPNTDESNNTVQMQGVGEVSESKEEMKYCHIKSDDFAKDEGEVITIYENREDIHLADEATNWEVMVEQDEGSFGDSQTEKKEETNIEVNMLESLESEMEMQKEALNAKPLRMVVQSTEDEFEEATQDNHITKDKFGELETVQELKKTTEETCLKILKKKIQKICSNYEENKGVYAKYNTEENERSDDKCIKMNANELGECIVSKTMALLENVPQFEATDADFTEEGKGKIKIQVNADEKERLETTPDVVKCNLSATVNNVQEDSEGSREVKQEISDKEDCPCNKNETNDSLKGASELNKSTFAEEDLKDSGNNSDSESSDSGSEEEMELYMHCLRAVYGQRSSPKARKHEQNREKEFKRPSITRSKRLSTSLPSISESVDEEQQLSSQEKDLETVEVQPAAAPALSDSSYEEENVNYLWWKKTFSCRNIPKTLLYATVVVLFLAVAYHYDFIACFGLYVISVVWLCCQGERQSSKE